MGPDSLAFDRSGNLFVSEAMSRDIRKISPQGNVSTFFRGESVDPRYSRGRFRPGLAVDASGNLYSNEVPFHPPSATGTQTAGGFIIRKFDAAGTASIFAGSTSINITSMYPANVDGVGSEAVFSRPSGMAIDAAGTLFIGDGMGSQEVGGMFRSYKLAMLRKIAPDARVTTFAGPTGNDGYFYAPAGIAIDAGGNIYVSDGTLATISKVSPQGNVSTVAQYRDLSAYPSALAVDGNGNVYAALPGDHTVVRLTPSGSITVVAGTKGIRGLRTGPLPGTLDEPRGLAIGPDGYLYISSAYAVVKIPLAP
jgi:hypothetical protein